jgi:Cytochrome c554 and c-prime
MGARMHASSIRSHLGSLALTLGAIAWLGACTDTVYRDRPPFNPPPDAASGFLGYYTAADNQTTCGNCHVGQQADWVQTKHASAWGDLQASGGAQPFCTGCHSVNSRGNQPFAKVGYDSVQSVAYHDVQCESCHGPGITHVENPSVKTNHPLASINVDTSAAITNNSCGGCHTDTPGAAKHNPFLKEWLSSRHGKLNTTAAPRPVTDGCPNCHEAKGILAAWNVNTVYKELGTSTLMPQVCPVCHDPHGSAKDASGNTLLGQTRFPIDDPNIATNLCTHCHNRVGDATPTNSRGPHGAQGPMLFGTAGYFPPGTLYDTTAIITTHGSAANPRLCAGCHVNSQAQSDAQGNVITFTGHTFHPLPCLQQKTPVPLVDTTYTNACAYTEQARSWISCTASGCHGTEAVAVSRLLGIANERRGYLDVLWVDLNHNQAVDPFPTDTGYLAKIKLNAPAELDFTTSVLTPAKGALFNAQLTGDSLGGLQSASPLSGHPDGSHGVHNPFLYRALLQSSIADLMANYGGFLPAPPAPILAEIRAAIQSGKLRMASATERAVQNAYLAQQRAGVQVGSR